MLWLALHFPRLSLDLLGDASIAPLAIVQTQGQTQRVVACNESAADAGVRPGQKLASALALCGGLRVSPRAERDERAALDRLATWALRFTSQVGLRPPCTLMLEIAASRRLFGGVVPLCQRALRELAELGYDALAAAAPTPAAARLLAWTRERRIVHRLAALANSVSTLPLTHAELSEDVIADLTGIGVRHFGELERLPRAELARRFGAALVSYLDRVHGRQPEPISPFQAPERFGARVELSYLVERVEGLQFTLRRLIRELVAWLVVRQWALMRAEIVLEHEDAPASRVDLGLSAPSGDAEQIFKLAQTLLDRLDLPGPVRRLGVNALECVPLAGDNHDLFARQSREDIARVVERLRARLGHDAVSMPALRDDHRPELASRRADLVSGSRELPRAVVAAPRPLMLLEPPQPLMQWLSRHAEPVRMEGPERIENGWWDGEACARDYFRMVLRDGRHLWVYRQRSAPRAWFVQGLFA